MRPIRPLLIHTFAVYRPMRDSDGQGGWQQSLVELSELRGRLRPAGASERTVADQELRHISHVLYTEGGADIRRGDVVVGAGLEVVVQGVREPSRAGHHLEIDCLEVQREPAEEGS